MAKTYKVLVNEGKGADNTVVQVVQGVGDKGSPVRLVAQRGVRYELQDIAKAKGYAPDQVRAKRVGSNLTLMFDGSQKPDVVIEDYYSPTIKGDGSAPVLAGLAENGDVYEYIPQDPNVDHLTSSLKDGNTPVLMALGGGAMAAGFELSALPLVAAAAGGISGWAIAGGLLGAAALGGGGGGGGGGGATPADTTPPGAPKVVLPEASQGVNATEAADGTTLDVTLPTDAVAGDTLITVVTKPDGSKLNLVHVLTTADIVAKVVTQTIPVSELKDATGQYLDGTWTTSTTVTDVAKNVSTATAASFVLDTSAPTAATGNLKHDTTDDTGVSSTDSITNNTTPVLVVSAESGAKVEVTVNGHTYVATETTTKGIYEVKVTDALSDATYTPVVVVTDAAGNKNAGALCTPFTVDTSPTNNVANGAGTDFNAGSSTTVQIQAVTQDTGTENDFITSARQVQISGSVSQFADTGISKGDSVLVQVFDSNQQLVASEYVHPSSNNGAWQMSTTTPALVDGTYTVKSAIVDAAGNVVKSSANQPLIISQTFFLPQDDAATAQEAGIDAQKIPVNTVNPTGNVFTNDVDVNATGRQVTKLQFGATSANVTSGTTSANGGLVVHGLYGDLTIGADGSYVYNVDNVKANSLTKNDQPTETFAYTATNSAGTEKSANLFVTVHGANDAASFSSSDITTGSLPIGSNSTLNGSLTVTDPDKNESTFATPINLNGTYGVFTFTPTGKNANWAYSLNSNASLAHGLVGTDSLVITSSDSSASETITVSVIGINHAPEMTNAVASISSDAMNLAAPPLSSTSQLPSGATKAKALITSSGVTDADSDPIGLAITSVDTTHGHLWCTTDHGQNWSEITSASFKTAWLIDATNDNTWLYYQQTSSGVTNAFAFVAWDKTTGQANTSVDASVLGGNTAFSSVTRQVVVDDTFNLTTTDNINIEASTGTDTIQLNGTGLSLDLASSTTHVTGVEIINMADSNTLKLNFDSLLQADQHQLTINGGTNVVVNFSLAGNMTSTHDAYVSGSTYDVYHLTSATTTCDLLVQHTINSVTFS